MAKANIRLGERAVKFPDGITTEQRQDAYDALFAEGIVVDDENGQALGA